MIRCMYVLSIYLLTFVFLGGFVRFLDPLDLKQSLKFTEVHSLNNIIIIQLLYSCVVHNSTY